MYIGNASATADHLRRRVRGFPLGFRVGFGTTRGLTLGVARFGGSDFPGMRRERVCVSFVSKPPLSRGQISFTAGRGVTFFVGDGFRG